MKTKKIESLEKKRAKFNGENSVKIAKIDLQLHAEYEKLFGKKRFKIEITNALKALDVSNEYCFDRNGEIQHWVRASNLLALVPVDARPFFEDYLHDMDCLSIDWENETVYNSCYGEIIINDDGDILAQDSGKWIISRKDHETEEERNALIEKHMEKTGYYPGVFSVDRHGNVFPVKTN